MSILSRIDEYLKRENEKQLKEDDFPDYEAVLRSPFDGVEPDPQTLVTRMRKFIYNLDPSVLDDEGKRIRRELVMAFSIPSQDHPEGKVPLDRSVENDDEATSSFDYEEEGEIVEDFDDVEEDEIVEEKRPRRRLQRR